MFAQGGERYKEAAGARPALFRTTIKGSRSIKSWHSHPSISYSNDETWLSEQQEREKDGSLSRAIERGCSSVSCCRKA